MVKKKDEAMFERIFHNMYICMKCNAKIRCKDPKNSKCRKCGSKALRLKNKDVKA